MWSISIAQVDQGLIVQTECKFKLSYWNSLLYIDDKLKAEDVN